MTGPKQKELIVRKAERNDVKQIRQFILELAIYEKAEHEVVTTDTQIEAALFCDHPKVFALICEHEGKPIGFAIYFYNYSTWLGQLGIYLEDLYVTPEARGLGAGKMLLKTIAEIAVENNCGRVDWAVLDWNEPAIEFYKGLGALAQDEWTPYRLTGDALIKFAKS